MGQILTTSTKGRATVSPTTESRISPSATAEAHSSLSGRRRAQTATDGSETSTWRTAETPKTQSLTSLTTATTTTTITAAATRNMATSKRPRAQTTTSVTETSTTISSDANVKRFKGELQVNATTFTSSITTTAAAANTNDAANNKMLQKSAMPKKPEQESTEAATVSLNQQKVEAASSASTENSTTKTRPSTLTLCLEMSSSSRKTARVINNMTVPPSPTIKKPILLSSPASAPTTPMSSTSAVSPQQTNRSTARSPETSGTTVISSSTPEISSGKSITYPAVIPVTTTMGLPPTSLTIVQTPTASNWLIPSAREASTSLSQTLSATLPSQLLTTATSSTVLTMASTSTYTTQASTINTINSSTETENPTTTKTLAMSTVTQAVAVFFQPNTATEAVATTISPVTPATSLYTATSINDTTTSVTATGVITESSATSSETPTATTVYANNSMISASTTEPTPTSAGLKSSSTTTLTPTKSAATLPPSSPTTGKRERSVTIAEQCVPEDTTANSLLEYLRKQDLSKPNKVLRRAATQVSGLGQGLGTSTSTSASPPHHHSTFRLHDPSLPWYAESRSNHLMPSGLGGRRLLLKRSNTHHAFAGCEDHHHHHHRHLFHFVDHLHSAATLINNLHHHQSHHLLNEPHRRGIWRRWESWRERSSNQQANSGHSLASVELASWAANRLTGRRGSSPFTNICREQEFNEHVQASIIKLFQRKPLKENEMGTLLEHIKVLSEAESGALIYPYYRDQLLKKGMVILREKIKNEQGAELLEMLGETWDYFFTQILPTLQALMYPLSEVAECYDIRNTTLLEFRNIVVLKVGLKEAIETKKYEVPANIRQMLLVLQGVLDPTFLSKEQLDLEKLVACVVVPFLGSRGYYQGSPEPVTKANYRPTLPHLPLSKPKITITVSDSSILEDDSPGGLKSPRGRVQQLIHGQSAGDLQAQQFFASPAALRKVSSLHDQPSSSQGILNHRLKPVLEVLDTGRRHSIVGT